MTSILDKTPTKPSLSPGDRLQQSYVIGSTGVGKSTLLQNMILYDIDAGNGLCVLDPHGDLIKDVISRMDSRLEDVILLSLTNPDLPFGLNLFHCPDPLSPIAVQNTVSTILNIFEKVYGVDRNTMARIINYLQALIYLFIHNPEITVLDIPEILDPGKESELLRLRLVQNLPPSPAYNYTRYFWTKYYNQRGYFGRDEELAGVYNKFREMTSVLLWPIFCQQNTIEFSELMAQRKIVLCKLNADWPDVTSLVGSILIGQILHAGYMRKHREPFFVYCDEFQNFATYDFARLFAEARKFNIALTISHQTTNQIESSIKDTCMQAGTIFIFRVSSGNAKELAGNFDTTPPPGEWIYEKQMRRAMRQELVEVWVSPEAEAEYKALEEELRSLQPTIDQLQQRHTQWQNTIPFWSEKKFSERLLAQGIPQLFSATMTPELWQIAEFIMGSFLSPDWNDPQVTAYLSSFYEEERFPLTFEGAQNGYSVRAYNSVTQQWEVRNATSIAERQDRDIWYIKQSWDKLEVKGIRYRRSNKPLYFARARLRPYSVQPGVAYAFPTYLPCHFEHYLVNNYLGMDHGLYRTFGQALQQFYTPYKKRARYYFDFDRYKRDYNDGNMNIDDIMGGIADKALKYHFHWKGPYFESDRDWLTILQWFYDQAEKFRPRLTPLLQQAGRLQARMRDLFTQYHRSEWQSIWSGWYEPVPVVEWEYLRVARVLGEEVYVGDNVRYTARLGPSPYTSAEMEAQIANKLAHLPNYTACIKTPSGEFVVTTSLPRPAVSEQEFRRRVRCIWRNNLRQGYLRKREDVEQELMEREPLVPDLSAQPIHPRRPPASPIGVPPLPQSRKKPRRPITMQGSTGAYR